MVKVLIFESTTGPTPLAGGLAEWTFPFRIEGENIFYIKMSLKVSFSDIEQIQAEYRTRYNTRMDERILRSIIFEAGINQLRHAEYVGLENRINFKLSLVDLQIINACQANDPQTEPVRIDLEIPK